METNPTKLKIGKTYLITCKTNGIKKTVILSRLGNPTHKNPIHMAAQIERPSFNIGFHANEWIWEIVAK